MQNSDKQKRVDPNGELVRAAKAIVVCSEMIKMKKSMKMAFLFAYIFFFDRMRLLVKGGRRMIDELIQSGEYNQALSLLNDMNDENTRYLRLVCLVGLQEYQQAKLEGALAKAKAEETYYDVVSMYVTTLKELGEFEEAINILIEEIINALHSLSI